MFEIFNAEGNDIEFLFEACDIPYHSGRCDETVRDFYYRYFDTINKIPIENARKILHVTGLDDSKNPIVAMCKRTVYQYVIWLAAGEAYENIDNKDYIHTDGRIWSILSTY